MRIVRISPNKQSNKQLEFVITVCCSLLLVLTLWKPSTLTTLIQGDVGGWSTPNEKLSTIPNTSIDKSPPKETKLNKTTSINKKLISSSVGKRIARVAKNYSDRREICSIRPESCARCVRAILKDAGCNFKIISSNPIDGWTKPYGSLYANSLWGKDIGQVKGKNAEVLPGDLVFFENTYRGKWWNKRGLVPKDKYNTGKESYTPVVTHIEIAISSTKMVGKRNAFKPMSQASIRNRFGNKFLGSITLYANFCNNT
jgi:hypothetical protein